MARLTAAAFRLPHSGCFATPWSSSISAQGWGSTVDERPVHHTACTQSGQFIDTHLAVYIFLEFRRKPKYLAALTQHEEVEFGLISFESPFLEVYGNGTDHPERNTWPFKALFFFNIYISTLMNTIPGNHLINKHDKLIVLLYALSGD